MYLIPFLENGEMKEMVNCYSDFLELVIENMGDNVVHIS